MNKQELLGTKVVVSRKDQVKFYAEGPLMADFQLVLDEQGLTLSEGMVRLIQLAVESPDELRPVIFRQARGNAAAALARHVLRQETPMRIAASSAGSTATPDDRPDEIDPDTGKPRRRK